MKKLLSLLLAVILCASIFTGCASNNSENSAEINSLESLKGKNVAVQTGTTSEDKIKELNEQGYDIKMQSYESVVQCFDDLKLGRVDAVLTDSVVAAYYTNGNDGYVNAWMSKEAEPMGLCLKKGNEDLTAIIEAAVDTLYYNGKIEELAKKNFGQVEGYTDTTIRKVTEEPTIDTSKLNSLLLEDGVLKVGAEISYPPMEYVAEDGKTFVGFDVDLMEEVGKLLGVKIEWVNITFDAIFSGLDRGDYDIGVSAISITPERQQNYSMTEPYVANCLEIVTAG